jgi:hypothetical protein
MNRISYSARGLASAVALAAAAGLVLAACGGKASGGSTGAGSTSSGSGSTGGSSPSSSSGNGSTSTTSASVPFPIAVGNTWVYNSSTLAGTSSTVTDKVIAVTPVPGGNRVTMSNSNSLSGSTTQITYIFHSDGSITYPFTQLGKTAVIIKGSLEWPSAAVIASGQPTNSTVEMALATGTSSEHVTAHMTVKGAGTATVAVPAGTYSATIVQMTEKFTVLTYTGTIVVQTWVANGVGPVESEATITEAGHSQVVSHLKLVSFTKG